MADIHLLPQRADAADLVMPSKINGILASGRPVVACDDATAFTTAVLALADDAPRRAALGRAARTYAETNLGHAAVLGAFEMELRRLVEGG